MRTYRTVQEKMRLADVPDIMSGQGEVLQHLANDTLLCEVWFITTDELERVLFQPTLFRCQSASEVPVGTVFGFTLQQRGDQLHYTIRVESQEKIDQVHREWATDVLRRVRNVS